MPEGDGYDHLRDLKAQEEAILERLETVREKIGTEVRALHNGAFGRPRSLAEISEGIGISKTAVYNWARRGRGTG